MPSRLSPGSLSQLNGDGSSPPKRKTTTGWPEAAPAEHAKALGRDKPSVDLAGWWGPDRFYAGGDVLTDQPISRVRLTSRNGTTLKDNTEAGVVLFLTDRTIDLPVTLELRDDAGQVLASQLALEMPR